MTKRVIEREQSIMGRIFFIFKEVWSCGTFSNKEGLAGESSRESSTTTGVANRCFPFLAFKGLGSGETVAANTATTAIRAFLPVRGISFYFCLQHRCTTFRINDRRINIFALRKLIVRVQSRVAIGSTRVAIGYARKVIVYDRVEIE